MKKQNKEMFYYRDQLKALPKKVLIELLEHNNQEIPSGSEQVTEILQIICRAVYIFWIDF